MLGRNLSNTTHRYTPTLQNDAKGYLLCLHWSYHILLVPTAQPMEAAGSCYPQRRDINKTTNLCLKQAMKYLRLLSNGMG